MALDYSLALPNLPGRKRWDMARFVAFRFGAFDPLNSYIVETIPLLPISGVYTVLDCENRPDMISAGIYNGDTQYWWLLLLYNDMWDFTGAPPFQIIPVGTKINYFSVDDVEKTYFTMKSAALAFGGQ